MNNPDENPFLKRGTAAYRRANIGIFCAGLATFALIYCVQPLLPLLAADFGVSTAASSLALSLTTLCLALCLLVAGALAEAWGRKPLMLVALAVANVLALGCVFVSDWPLLLTLRASMGVALAGLPALAMAYVGEEFDPPSLPQVMGLYISGNVIGGLAGRLLSGALADLGGWQWALGGIALLGIVSLVLFAWLLPPSRHFVAQPLSVRSLGRNFIVHLRNPALQVGFALAFLLMGGFVAVFNYVGFHLAAPPYRLSNTAIGLLFLVYLVGSWGARKGGALVGRFGARRMVQGAIVVQLFGIAACAIAWLPAIVGGLALLTGGFFAAHAVASGQVGLRADGARAQAASLYLSAYYLGSALIGYAGGSVMEAGGWLALLACIGALLCLCAWLVRRW